MSDNSNSLQFAYSLPCYASVCMQYRDWKKDASQKILHALCFLSPKHLAIAFLPIMKSSIKQPNSDDGVFVFGFDHKKNYLKKEITFKSSFCSNKSFISISFSGNGHTKLFLSQIVPQVDRNKNLPMLFQLSPTYQIIIAMAFVYKFNSSFMFYNFK